jgi:hypothetical protein
MQTNLTSPKQSETYMSTVGWSLSIYMHRHNLKPTSAACANRTARFTPWIHFCMSDVED